MSTEGGAGAKGQAALRIVLTVLLVAGIPLVYYLVLPASFWKPITNLIWEEEPEPPRMPRYVFLPTRSVYPSFTDYAHYGGWLRQPERMRGMLLEVRMRAPQALVTSIPVAVNEGSVEQPRRWPPAGRQIRPEWQLQPGEYMAALTWRGHLLSNVSTFTIDPEASAQRTEGAEVFFAPSSETMASGWCILRDTAPSPYDPALGKLDLLTCAFELTLPDGTSRTVVRTTTEMAERSEMHALPGEAYVRVLGPLRDVLDHHDWTHPVRVEMQSRRVNETLTLQRTLSSDSWATYGMHPPFMSSGVLGAQEELYLTPYSAPEPSFEAVVLLPAQDLAPAGVHLVAHDDAGAAVAGGLTDTEGRYTFFGLPEGSYRVQALEGSFLPGDARMFRTQDAWSETIALPAEETPVLEILVPVEEVEQDRDPAPER